MKEQKDMTGEGGAQLPGRKVSSMVLGKSTGDYEQLRKNEVAEPSLEKATYQLSCV